MSKASEYAAAMQEALTQAPPNLQLCDPDCRETIITAGALSDGRLAVMQAGLSMRLDPANAIKLARWILDTFGDGKPHRCDLPDSIKEALNSGDGTYRP